MTNVTTCMRLRTDKRGSGMTTPTKLYNLVYENIIQVVLLPEKGLCEAIISMVLADKKAEKRGVFNVV